MEEAETNQGGSGQRRDQARPGSRPGAARGGFGVLIEAKQRVSHRDRGAFIALALTVIARGWGGGADQSPGDADVSRRCKVESFGRFGEGLDRRISCV